MPLQGKEKEDMTTKVENRILEQISRILVREKQITPEEQLRMLELIRKRCFFCRKAPILIQMLPEGCGR